MCQRWKHRLFFGRLETQARKKKNFEKKFVFVAKIFCGHAYSADLIRLIPIYFSNIC